MAGELENDPQRKELETIRDVLARLQAMSVATQGRTSGPRSGATGAGLQDDGASKGSQGVISNPVHRQPDGFLSSFVSFREADEVARRALAQQNSSPISNNSTVYEHSSPGGRMGLAGAEDGPKAGRDGELRSHAENRNSKAPDEERSRGVGGRFAIAALGMIAIVGGGVFVLATSQPPTVSPVAAQSIQVPSATALTSEGSNAETDLVGPVALAPVPTAHAEAVAEPVVKAPAIEFERVIEISGGGAVSLPLRIDAAVLQAVTDYYVTLSGLPTGAMLSKGRMVFPGTWAVEQNELQDLRLVMPLNGPATIMVGLMLVARPGRVIAEGNGVITVRGAAGANPSDPSARGAEIVDVSRGAVGRGLALLATEKIGAARALFKDAAEAGDPDGAYFLGLTYDPQFSRNGNGDDAKPDVDLAKQWYSVAASRGSADAAERLRQLNAK